MEVTPEDRKLIERLRLAIADPTTTGEQREELREELGDILHSYVVANMLEADTENAEEDAGCSHAESAVPSYGCQWKENWWHDVNSFHIVTST